MYRIPSPFDKYISVTFSIFFQIFLIIAKGVSVSHRIFGPAKGVRGHALPVENVVHCKVKFIYLVHFENSN